MRKKDTVEPTTTSEATTESAEPTASTTPTSTAKEAPPASTGEYINERANQSIQSKLGNVPIIIVYKIINARRK